MELLLVWQPIFPPHNLAEVVNGAIALIKNPQIPLDELMQHIPGPDFPTGGIIYGRSSILQAYSTGKGILRIRAKTEFETIKRKSREVTALIIHEVPYQVNKARLIERIADLVNDRTIDGISNIRDESDRSGMRVVLELKRDATNEVVLNQLFKHTPLQVSFGVINLAIVEGKPVVCTLTQLLSHFLDHRRDVVVRRTNFDLKKAEARMHILEGFKIALLNIDEVIELIKASESPPIAREGLMKKYELTEVQAQAILDLRLQKLTGMERLAIEKEHEELGKLIEELKAILADPKRVDQIIVEELTALKEEFEDKRRTEILDQEIDIDIEDMIEDEDMVVAVSHQGYVKRTAVTRYRSQKRGGKGVTGASSKDEDFIEHLFVTSTLAYLLVFTNHGRVYWQKVYEIPESGRTARGRALVNLLKLKDSEKITAILPVREFEEGKFVVMATEKGYIKKLDLMELSRPRRGGIVACSLAEGDRMISAGLTEASNHVVLATRSGMAIRFEEDQVRPMGRTARGVRGVRLKSEDQVVGMTIVTPSDESGDDDVLTMLTVCEQGYGKRTKLTDYRAQNRGGKGLIDIQTTERNGQVVGVCAVRNDSGLMMITSSGKIIRFNAGDVSVIGRNTKGVRLINLDEDEKVVAVARMVENG